MEGQSDDDVYPENEEDTNFSSNPTAPASSELFEISTTIDPSYIISLIRKLLPCNTKLLPSSHGETISSHEKYLYCEEKNVTLIGETRCSQTDEVLIEKNTDPLSRERMPERSTSNEIINCDPEMEETDLGINNNCLLHEKSDPWEDVGCILWDLSAEEIHAQFMVENLLLDVLFANLTVFKSARVTEICLGILGNLVCHQVSRNFILSKKELIEIIILKLFLEDPQCLSETCRLLAFGLQCNGHTTWAKELQEEYILERVVWIAENTLNSQLLEKVLGVLLEIVNGSDEVVDLLLPVLINLDFPNRLVHLLDCEMQNLTIEKIPERPVILDMILRIIEGLSVRDNYSSLISSNQKVQQLICDVIKLPYKIEVDSACLTAVVSIGHFLVDEPTLAYKLAQDFSFLQSLFDVFPLISIDGDERSSLWTLVGRLLIHVHLEEMSSSDIQKYVFLLKDNSDLIFEDVDVHKEKNLMISDSKDRNGTAKAIALRRIASILEKWIVTSNEDLSFDGRIRKLLNYCESYCQLHMT